ncbi:MAG: potassium/hydrogen antiporter [Mycobacteriales bacterium]
MSVEQLNLVLGLGSLVLLVAVAAVRVSTGVGLPSLLFYLALGLGLGESGLGIRFDNAALTQVLGLTALAVILAEGGLTTRWATVRPAVGFAAVLSTVGVGVSVAVTAAIAKLVLASDWRTAILVGAVVTSTDAAAVFSVLRRLGVRSRLAAALEAESGFNDAPVVILVSLVASEHWSSTTAPEVLGVIGYELVAGAAIGLAVGWIGQQLLSRSALPAAGLYPLATVALLLFGYAAAGLAHASGFLAIYLAGLWLGNARLPHRRAVLGFVEGLAWLAQIGLFVLLGLLASPGRLPGAVLPALAIGAGLLLVARPASVLASALPFRLPWREQAFLSWAGLRGAVPIVLATIPLTEHLAAGEQIFDIVFVLVVVFTLVQAPTLPWVARRLAVADPDAAAELSVDVAPLDNLHADLLQVEVPPGSRLAGVYLDELRLPDGAAVTLIARRAGTIVPAPGTRLAVGDHLVIVTTAAARRLAERRLRAVSRSGRLARWLGDTGD